MNTEQFTTLLNEIKKNRELIESNTNELLNRQSILFDNVKTEIETTKEFLSQRIDNIRNHIDILNERVSILETSK